MSVLVRAGQQEWGYEEGVAELKLVVLVEVVDKMSDVVLISVEVALFELQMMDEGEAIWRLRIAVLVVVNETEPLDGAGWTAKWAGRYHHQSRLSFPCDRPCPALS